MRVPQTPEDTFPGICTRHGACWEGLCSGPAIAARAGRAAREIPQGEGGGLGEEAFFDRLREEVQTALAGYIVAPELGKGIRSYIVPPGLGDDAGVRGALALALEALRGR
jgi:fructokinase